MRRSHRDLLLVISGSQTGCPCLDQADFKCTDNGCGDGDDAAKELFREKGYFHGDFFCKELRRFLVLF